MIHNAREIRLDRLQRIHDHLVNGQLSADRWHFGTFRTKASPVHPVMLHQSVDPVFSENPSPVSPMPEVVTSGTLGDAVGEFPFLFGDDWGFLANQRPDETPLLYKGSSGDPVRDVPKYLGLTHHQSLHLFWPAKQDRGAYGGQWLPVAATRQDVADNLAEFIFLVEATLGNVPA